MNAATARRRRRQNQSAIECYSDASATQAQRRRKASEETPARSCRNCVESNTTSRQFPIREQMATHVTRTRILRALRWRISYPSAAELRLSIPGSETLVAAILVLGVDQSFSPMPISSARGKVAEAAVGW
jgi:hypothetical protein